MGKNLILIVDDVSKNLELMEAILEKKGYDITVATNGAEVFKTLLKTVPDLILLDIMMPGMNGFEVCKRIKDEEKYKNIPVIFLTGKSSTDDVVKGLKMGATDYITKPFNSTELALRVKTQIDLKKSRDMLQKRNDELQQLNASKDKFFSIISHDLKSPFQGLIGLSELLAQDVKSLSKQEILEYTNMINESARSLLNLLDNLLEWSVLERNKLECEPRKTDISEIIDKNIQLFSASSNKKNISLIPSITEPVFAWIDRNMVDTVIRNILSNAIKYTSEGGTIELSTILTTSDVRIKISDSGVGMDKKVVQSLFQIDKVTSRPGTNNEKGTGLGLLICKELIDKNRGTIEVESTPGRGTTFTIGLPVKKSEPNKQMA